MDLLRSFSFVLLLCVSQHCPAAHIAFPDADGLSPPRIFYTNKPDDGSLHCLGNGQLCAFEQGPDIVQLFGPPYSSPSFMQLLLTTSESIRAVSRRETGTAIWHHRLLQNGNSLGWLTDFVDAESPAFIRHCDLKEKLIFSLRFAEGVNAILDKRHFTRAPERFALAVVTRAGKYIYNNYPTRLEKYHQIVLSGNASLKSTPDAQEWILQCGPGQCTIYVCGGADYPSCICNTERILVSAPAELLKRTRDYWNRFTRSRHDFSKLLPGSTPDRDKLLQAIDDVSVIIKTHQSQQGGVMAGHNYHLAYVRDQYGVSRCLLKLGYDQQARAMLQHDWSVWQKHHKLRNAQGMGVDGIFHIHENDDVEITSYLIIQAFDYLNHSNDHAFIGQIFPMLQWAWEAQTRHLVKNMLPFNGDETYIAGGFLPRSTINDGSAEATLLFITGGRQLLDWVRTNAKWSEQSIKKAEEILTQTAAAYYKNFWQGGHLLTNNPARAAAAILPRFRHGVCEATGRFGWTEKNRNNRYVSPFVSVDKPLPPAEARKYDIKSVSLIPLYISATIPTAEELAPMVAAMAEQYRTTGKLPSTIHGSRTVGYDYGLLLYNLTELNHPLAAKVYEKMMMILDPTGAWVEYYEDGKPRGTRCRPWESAINLEAALHFALSRHESYHRVLTGP